MCVCCAGGEGSVLGAGGSVIGIGSDIGGSIRMPCFFNGIFGHKPTSGKCQSVCVCVWYGNKKQGNLILDNAE